MPMVPQLFLACFMASIGQLHNFDYSNTALDDTSRFFDYQTCKELVKKINQKNYCMQDGVLGEGTKKK